MEAGRKGRKPNVLIPYTGPCPAGGYQDFFMYLRPESNGVLVESTMLGVIQNNPAYKAGCSLEYLANLPGEFIQRHRIVESHYALKLYFTKYGKAAFTPWMRHAFQTYYQVPFDTAEIVGAFEAQERLGIDEEDLFRLWVAAEDILYIHGQCIKRKGGLFIVNYDIPALLHKNSLGTDIAVMILRVAMERIDFYRMLGDIQTALTEKGMVGPTTPLGRVFHHSKGPFEQILDALGYLYDTCGNHISLKRISFCDYLLEKGVSMYRILHAIRKPLMMFGTETGVLEERNLITATYNCTYAQAYRLFTKVAANVMLKDPPDPLT